MKEFEQAHQRREHLHEIGKLFASFESIELTLDPAFDMAAKTLPLLSAMLIETDEEGQSRIASWPSVGRSADQMQEARRHLEEAYTYLVGAEGAEIKQSPHTELGALPQAVMSTDLTHRFIVIPLVVRHRPPFGALQLESARALDERDLIFVNAIANQLAVALQRDRARRKDIALRIEAESLREKYENLASENARLYEEARRAVAAREHVLAVVSHDLRSPLATILMTLRMVNKEGLGQERRKGLPQAVARMERSAERMTRLIEDLLDFASIEAGRLAIHPHREDPAALIQETVASFESVAHEKHLSLTSQTGANLPPAYCDRDRILQVLANMVSNATKATADGGKIQVGVDRQPDGHLLFSVSDSGRGIGEEDKQHIFERYFRSDDASYKGAGLGLAIAKGIVEAHDGEIWVESELQHGTTFFFTVPTCAAQA